MTGLDIAVGIPAVLVDGQRSGAVLLALARFAGQVRDRLQPQVVELLPFLLGEELLAEADLDPLGVDLVDELLRGERPPLTAGGESYKGGRYNRPE